MFPSKKQIDNWVTFKNISFNPCSLGCFPRSLSQSSSIAFDTEFQSLFSWMFPSKIKTSKHSEDENKFQSLFSWMFPSKGGKEVIIMAELILFQSLFSWMFPSKTTGTTGSQKCRNVSILVLLDVSLEVDLQRERLFEL